MKKIMIMLMMLIFVVACAEQPRFKIASRSSDETIKLKIIEPRESEIIGSDDVKIVFELENVNIGKNQILNFVLDDSSKVKHYSTEPFLLSGLSDGRHVVRAFITNNFGESIKDTSAFAIRQFYVKKNNTPLLNLAVPMLTYNEPIEAYSGDGARRVLLDFLVSNAVVSKNGYHVVYTVDGVSKELTSVQPLYLTNFRPGVHTVTIELVDKTGNLAEGNFVRVQREIIVD